MKQGFTDAEKLALLREAVQRVLHDEESGEGGWGPDITMVTVLQEAMEATAPDSDFGAKRRTT